METGNDYVPTLAMRAAELKGLSYLPNSTKNRICPMLLLAPWLTSKSLDQAIEKFESAFPDRNYFMDLDRDYKPPNVTQPAQIEWCSLHDANNNYKNWQNFWQKYDQIIPCIQFHGIGRSLIEQQIESVQSQNRSFCLRFESQRPPKKLDEIIECLTKLGTADYKIMLDGGWISNTNLFKNWINDFYETKISSINDSIPIILSFTTSPKGYYQYEGMEEIKFDNNQIVTEFQRSTNRNIIYGDWASTKPREYGFGSVPLPRIDYPLLDSWIIARNKEDQWMYQEASQAIKNSEYWDGELGVWGEEMIEATASGEDYTIDSPQKNVTSRVNIHIHLQAFRNYTDFKTMDLEDDWED